MTIKSDEITMGNPNFVDGFSYHVHNVATTILVNWSENII